MALSRRSMLLRMAFGTAGLGLAPWLLRGARAETDGPRYLVIMGCFGGASMIDALMPIDPGEALTLSDRGTVIGHDRFRPDGSDIWTVDRETPAEFVERFAAQSVVMGTQSSSVNHFTAQSRWMTGRDTHFGRTMAEIMALAYGTDQPLPNVNMGRGGYSIGGQDPGIDPRALAEVVVNPVTFPLSTHGHLGITEIGDDPLSDPAVRSLLIEEARAFREQTLETSSPFAQTFAHSRLRKAILQARRASDGQLEAAELINQLLFVPDLGDIFPLDDFGLSPSDEASAILSALPDAFPTSTSGSPDDRLQAQAALAYLLIRTNSSSAITLTEPGTDGFLAFDQSHQDHASAQATHWDRVLWVIGQLIGLLSDAPYYDGEGNADGTTLWDRTLIVFNTEFGRDKWDTGSSFGTGHHLNNGLLAVSPLLRGNQSLGDADPNNGFICGWDPDTGEATPFDDIAPGEDPLYSDERLPPSEEAVCGTMLEALGISFDGQQRLPVLLPES